MPGAGAKYSPMTNPGAEQGGRRGAGGGRLRGALLAAIGILYLVSVPWYRSDDQPLQLFLGLPDWVGVAVLCYAAAAVLNALAWLRTPVRDDAPLAESLVRGKPQAGSGELGEGEEAAP